MRGVIFVRIVVEELEMIRLVRRGRGGGGGSWVRVSRVLLLGGSKASSKAFIADKEEVEDNEVVIPFI